MEKMAFQCTLLSGGLIFAPYLAVRVSLSPVYQTLFDASIRVFVISSPIKFLVSCILYPGAPISQRRSPTKQQQQCLGKRGWTGGYPTPTSLPLSPHFPPPFTPLPSPSPPTSLPLQPHFPPPVRFFPPPDKILFLFMNLSLAKNQN